MVRSCFIVLLVISSLAGNAYSLLIPMDGSQRNHLKAYGIAFFTLQKGITVDWLLNYRGGSFLIPYSGLIENECIVRGISFEPISDLAANNILSEIANPAVNMNVIKLETAPTIAVYSIKNELVPDETDAVITVLDYAEIPYTLLYDEEILRGDLVKYDWLHLHHEDFTGQIWRFRWRQTAIIESKMQEATAARLGYATVSQMKLDVAKTIKAFCAGGGYLFAMCSGAETFDIALAAEGTNLDGLNYGDDDESTGQAKLDYTKALAFENFTLEHQNSRKFSDINTGRPDFYYRDSQYFQLFEFSAKWDVIPVILTQDHEHTIKEFTGQTTSFNKYVVKSEALVLGENRKANNVRYIYGELGRGHWTYYSGHDPESSPGRRHGPTDLNQYPNSPGYRLILNNVLFPSARKKKQKT